MKRTVALCIFLMSTLLGCGSVSKDGSTSIYKTGTVTYSQTINSNPIEATVAAAPNPAYLTTDAVLTVETKSFTSVTNKYDFTIKNIRITYSKIGDTPFSMTRTSPDTTLKKDSSTPIPLILARADIKDELVNDHGFSPGNSPRWSFYVNVDFDVYEDVSGDHHHYTTQLGTINFL